MLRIVDANGENETTVTKGVFDNLYKRKGYKIVSPEVVEQVKDAKVVEDKTVIKEKYEKKEK